MFHNKCWANVNWIDASLSSGLASSTVGPEEPARVITILVSSAWWWARVWAWDHMFTQELIIHCRSQQSPATTGLFSFLRIFSKHLVIWSWQHPWVWEKSPWQFIWNPQIQKALKDRCLFINLVQIWQRTLNWTNVMLFMISAYHT